MESFAGVLADARIREIVISDDFSKDGSFEKLMAKFSGHVKVKVFRNKANVDCYRNKRQAVELATSDWVILLDDDNIIDGQYLDAIYKQLWKPEVIYCPDWAKPSFNYTSFSGVLASRRNIRMLLSRPHFDTVLNTCNYFLHRPTYLACWDGSINPHTADTLFHALNHILKGGSFMVVPGLRYWHRIHEGSHYKRNWRKTAGFDKVVKSKLMALR